MIITGAIFLMQKDTELNKILSYVVKGEENPVKLAIKSEGPRASREQLKQLSSMKGLVIDPLGKIIEVPTKSNPCAWW